MSTAKLPKPPARPTLLGRILDWLNRPTCCITPTDTHDGATKQEIIRQIRHSGTPQNPAHR